MKKMATAGTTLRWMLASAAATAIGATVASSCTERRYPTVAFRCDPSIGGDACPETHFCCSDDPAAEGGGLPGYAGLDVPGGTTPFFSGDNNALGTSGMCVYRDDIPFGSGLSEPAAANCPIPCNPTWSGADIEAVCGAGRSCCQTAEVRDADCVIDPDSGSFRPVTGADIGVRYDNGTEVTNWSKGAHETHQDPGGVACQMIAGVATEAELATNEVWLDCVANLTVANQRGYCMALPPGQLCPAMQPGFVDACTKLEQARVGG